MILFAAGACGGEGAPPPPVPARPAAVELVGLCDASAAVSVGPWLVVADDEHDVLRVYDAALAPAGTVDLGALDPGFAGEGEADLEGMTTAPDGTVWVVGSHDPGKRTAPDPRRRVLFGLRLAPGPDGLAASLAGPVDRSGAFLAPVEAGTEGRTAKDPHGLSVEGLSFRDGALVVGFRAPVRDGRAPLVRLSPGGPELSWLDLGGRGIRSLEEDLVLAGGDAGFALFRLGPDGVPRREPADFGDLTPEALVRRADGWWVISDDGRREVDGTECRDLPEARRRARIAPLAALQAAEPSAN